ncbi:MAG TPA: pyridoxal phosphate-dependent aminotransferase [Acidobacteriota bacterium]|nr:pyridoxal phosphate-dependent aminotransferase [Acidobacteriota bacterium]
MKKVLSNRLRFDVRKNLLTQTLEEKRRTGERILDLTCSNPTICGFQYPESNLLQALSNPKAMIYEPHPAGLPEAREVVASIYRRRGAEVSPRDFFLTASTSEAYSFLFKLLADSGDEVLIPRPGYPLFEDLASLEGLRVRYYSLEYHGRWWVDLQGLRGAITPRSRALVVINPNNPTGSFLSEAEWRHIQQFSTEAGLAIICDEVFFDYPILTGDRESPFDLLPEWQAGPAFFLGGLSKFAGLPQMKLSWILLRGPQPVCEELREGLELVADAYLSVGALVQHSLKEIVGFSGGVRDQIRQRVAGNYRWLESSVQGSAIDLFPAEGGWYTVLQLPRVMDDEKWCVLFLKDSNVLVHPGYLFGFVQEGMVVVSLLPEAEVFRVGISRLLNCVDRAVQ